MSHKRNSHVPLTIYIIAISILTLKWHVVMSNLRNGHVAMSTAHVHDQIVGDGTGGREGDL